jgi:hypothetical protein
MLRCPTFSQEDAGMLTLRVDPSGELDVRWPASDEEVVALARRYVEHEKGLKLRERCPAPTLRRVEAALRRAEDAVSSADAGETERSRGSQSYRKALDEAVPLLEKAIAQLKSRHGADPAVLSQWGLETKDGKRGTKVLKPAKRKQWAELLTRYVERELALPEAERLQKPSLSRLASLAAHVRDGRQSRESGRVRRGAAAASRRVAVQELLDLLQVAAAVLSVGRFGGRVGRELEAWGFGIVEHAARRRKKAAPPVPAKEQVPSEA